MVEREALSESACCRYTADKFPVLAFTGAPAHFPVERHHVGLQKYLEWSENITEQVDKFIEENIGTEKFLGIHLRLGSDFVSTFCFFMI